MLYGDVFGTSAVLSGYDQPIVGSWGGRNGVTFTANTLSSLVGKPRSWPLNMYVFGAQLDRDALHLAKNLSRASYHAGDRVELKITAEGGHNWATWREQMPELYRWWQQVRNSDTHKDVQLKGTDSRALVGSIAAMLLVILAVMLPINRLGEFYSSLTEIVQTITGAI